MDQPSKQDGAELRGLAEGVRVTRRSVTAMLAAFLGGEASAQQAPTIARPLDLGRDRIDLTARPISGLDKWIVNLAPVTYRLRRAQDMLILDVRLINIGVSGSYPNATMSRLDAAKPGVMVVDFPPQAIAEHTFIVGESPATAASRIAGPSRLAFSMPDGAASAPWSVEGVLGAARTWPMRLSPLAKPEPQKPFFIGKTSALDLARERLNLATEALIKGLPASQRAAVTQALPSSASRIGAQIAADAAAGVQISDARVDAVVASELDQIVKSGGQRQTAAQRMISQRALEAAGAVVAIDALRKPSPSDSIRVVGRAIDYAPIYATLIDKPHRPADTVTAIEAPYRLVQTPLATAGWFHADAPVKQKGDRTELWHTRLGRGGATPQDLATQPLRAIWTPDYPEAGPNVPDRPAITSGQRRDIVRLTAGFDEKVASGSQANPTLKPYVPVPTQARRLILTALGATLDSDGTWPTRPAPNGRMLSIDVSQWRHKSALGRDHYVKIVEEGYLFPFGHRAAKVTISERKFVAGGGGRLALLRQRFFIIVREHARDYPGSVYPKVGREFPFQRIEVVTDTTPDLDPGNPTCDQFNDQSAPHPEIAFAPMVRELNGQVHDFLFRLVATDRSGRQAPFLAPLMFVFGAYNSDAQKIAKIGDFYTKGNPGCPKTRNVVNLHDAPVQLAAQASNGDVEGDTIFKIETMTFAAVPPAGSPLVGDPMFAPVMAEAKPKLDQVSALLGQEAAPRVAFTPLYLDQGFTGANEKAQIFLNLIQAASPLAVDESNPSDAFGGFMSPNMTPSALSRKFGAVAGANNAQKLLNGTFDIGDFLPSARLLGAVDLKDVLKSLLDVVLSASGVEAPKFKTVKLPEQIVASFDFERAPLDKVEPIFTPLGGSSLKLHAKTVAHLPAATAPPTPPPPPEASIEAELLNFQINLFGCLILSFNRLRFDGKAGRKPKVDVDLDPKYGVLFGGPLEFVNGLKDLIPSAGFGDPSPLSVTPTGISASYSLALPSIQIGVCSIANISLGAAFDIAFTGAAPRARFNFAERHSPFTITVSMFGGGGFFALTVDTGGMREVEASLEFGAQIEIDLGVASGGVYIKGGFYFSLKDDGTTQSVYFEGFVELGGHLSVIGLITVSLVFHLALAYEKDGAAKTSRLFGQAILTVEVEILFFSVSVDIKVERQFAGGKADPLFVDFMPTKEVWHEYCDAFA